MGWLASTRARPLAGWVIAGEVIGGLGLLLNIVVVLAFFQYGRGLAFNARVDLALGGLPWWVLLGSVSAGLLLWGGALWVVVAYVARARVERRRRDF